MPTLLRRGWNWCRRFRHRKGYGVHSPSDFYLITFVIYEQTAYNAYRPLHELRSSIRLDKRCYREKTEKLLLRLANYLQPQAILEIGTGNGIDTCYLANGKKAPLLTLADTDEALPTDGIACLQQPLVTQKKGRLPELIKEAISQGKLPPLIHLAHTAHYRQCLELMFPYIEPQTCLIVGTPYADKKKQRWWKELIEDPRTGVTFDLYDIGIVFFDKKRVKEHRIVNFL